MAKKLPVPCSAPKRGLPCEIKYDYAMGGYTGILRGFFYAIREEYGAAAALKIYEKVCKMDDRIKNLVNRILTIFKVDGNDAEAIAECWNIWCELASFKHTWIERSKTIARAKITECLFKTQPKDISNWCKIFGNLIGKSVNTRAYIERPKRMCAGDPYCEYVWKIEE